MSSKVPFPPPGFDELSAEDRADYAEALSGYVEQLANVPVDIPDWHKEILDERMARYEKEGMTGISWEELEKQLLEQLIKGAPKDN